jgi:predicted nucleic-acid-binding protein
MKYFFIDTNNFISCALLEEVSHSPETIDKLISILESNKIKLFLPEIVEIEFFREVETNYSMIEEAVNKLIDNLTKNFPDYLKKDKNDFIQSAKEILKKRNESKSIAKEKIKSLFNSQNVIRIPLNIEIFVNAFKRALAGNKPYKYSYCGECKNLRNIIDSDCLIFESLIYKLKELKEKAEILFCSDNIADFAEKDKKTGSPILYHSLKADFPDGISVKYYRHFTTALNSEFSAKIKKSDIKEIEKLSFSLEKFGKAYSSAVEGIVNALGSSGILGKISIDSGIDQLKFGQTSTILDHFKSLQESSLENTIKRSYESGFESYIKNLSESSFEKYITTLNKSDKK